MPSQGPRPFAPTMTLSDYLDAWLEARLPRLAPSSVRGYARYIREFDGIGGVTLDRLTLADVQPVVDGLSARGLAPRSVRVVLGVVKTALGDAHRNRLLDVDLAAGLYGPRIERSGRPLALSAEEADRFIEEATAVGRTSCGWRHWYGPYLAGVLLTGLRAGEARAVRWGDVALYADDGGDPRAGVHGLIQVRSQVPIDINDGDHQRLKSGSAARTVPISGRLAELMIAHRERIATYARRRDRSQWREAGYVWPRRTGGVATVEGIRAALALIADLVVLESRPTLHTLRHTWASHALDSGTPAHVVAAILGHSSIETTYEYYYDPTHQAYAAAVEADYRKGRPAGQGHPRLR